MLGIIGCTGNQQDKLLVVDVTKSYPKEELTLQDFMDVEYLALETNDEFLVQGNVAAVGEKFLIVTNMRQGDILLFDRVTGKYVRKINRKGNGPGEYVLPFNISLNEKENIMYVNDGPSSNIQVYDLEGEDRYSKAYFFQALKIDKNNPSTNFYFGDFYLFRKEYTKALHFYNKAFDNGYKETYDIMLRMAIVYEKLGDLLRANQYYKKAFLAKPNNVNLPEKIKSIEVLRYQNTGYYKRKRN